jgi:hypothetical protein
MGLQAACAAVNCGSLLAVRVPDAVTLGVFMRIVVSALVGAAIGYPVSYYLQPSMVHLKLTLGDYIANIGTVLGNGELGARALMTMAVFAAVGGVIGKVTTKKA